jgi:hypothetical protein
MSNKQQNNGWELEDEVVTTYRSIHLARVQAEGRGIEQERERIVALMELLPKPYSEETKNFVRNLLALIESGVTR